MKIINSSESCSKKSDTINPSLMDYQINFNFKRDFNLLRKIDSNPISQNQIFLREEIHRYF